MVHESRNIGSEERFLIGASVTLKAAFGKGSSKTKTWDFLHFSPELGFHHIDEAGFKHVVAFLLPARCVCHYA